MSTRGLIHFKNMDNQTMLTLYNHHDSYPEGLGRNLVEFLSKGRIGNGMGLDVQFGEFFNGFDDLVAQTVVFLKGNTVGGVYVELPDSWDMGEEYVYYIQELGEKDFQISYVEPEFGKRVTDSYRKKNEVVLFSTFANKEAVK